MVVHTFKNANVAIRRLIVDTRSRNHALMDRRLKSFSRDILVYLFLCPYPRLARSLSLSLSLSPLFCLSIFDIDVISSEDNPRFYCQTCASIVEGFQFFFQSPIRAILPSPLSLSLSRFLDHTYVNLHIIHR
jgi:hypothetical protein